jgi:hypothetical protein
MNFIITFSLLTFYFLFFFSIGNLLKLIINCNKWLILFLGIGFVAFFANFFYFLLDFTIKNIQIIFLLIFLISLFINTYKKNNFYYNFFFQYKFLIFFFFLASLISEVYGLQYYIFRGNYYDSTNYTNIALFFYKFNYSDLTNYILNIDKYNIQNIYIHEAAFLIQVRVLTPLLLSLFFNKNLVDIFLAVYIFKIFFLGIVILSIFYFFEYFKIVNKHIYLLSIAYVLGFWGLYIYEIDAFAQLTSLSFSILSLPLFCKFLSEIKNFNFNNNFILIIIFSTFFALYPEQFLIYALLFLIYFLLTNLKLLVNLSVLKNIFFLFFTFLFVIFFYENLFKFLFIQKNSLLSQNNWWGYFGSFILGKYNLVLDENFVSSLKNIITIEKNKIYLLKYIHINHLKNSYFFYYLNIIPSILGFYHISLGKIISFYDYFFIFFIFIFNIYLIKKIVNNINYCHISKKKYFLFNFLSLFFIFFTFFIFYLLINSALWQAIKLLFYFSFFIFILICVNFKFKSINMFLIFLMLCLPIYKFSKYNNGITRQDSFPSILNLNLKNKIEWDVFLESANFCIKNEKSVYLKNILLSQYLNYYSKTNYKILSECK